VARVVQEDYDMKGCRRFVLHNAIDTARLDSAPHDLRTMYSLRSRIVIGVGRYVEQKNFENLIMELRLLVDEGRNVSLVLVGDGRLRGIFEALIEKLGLRDRVALTGYRKDD